MSANREKKTKNYTVISNTPLHDNNLSMKATALLCLMLSLPEDWDFNQKGLTCFFKDGKHAIASALSELEEAGYLTRHRERKANGQFGEIVYTIYEHPRKPDEQGLPKSEDQEQVYSAQAFPEQDNQSQQNTELSSTNQPKGSDMIDRAYVERARIEENIGYENLIEKYGRERVDQLVEIMVDMFISTDPMCRINGTDVSRELVCKRLLEIDDSHVEYVFECVDHTSKRIINPKAYLLSALYNAPMTIEHYYRVEVNAESPSG